MKTLISTLTGFGIVCALSVAFANPALLPKHPGYPGGQAVSPVTGQPLAHDSGQTNMGGEKAILEGSMAGSKGAMQELRPEDGRSAIINEEGAGRVPKHPGYYDYKIEPPVNSATKIGPDRTIQ
jgi:hypothetical protein